MKKYNVPALTKAISILELIANSGKAYSTTEIHQQLDIPKATVFTILSVLEDNNMVKRDEKGRYKIGVRLYHLGMHYESSLVDIARPYLNSLMKETGFTVHLGILEEGETLYIDKVEPNSFIRFSTYPGMRVGAHVNSIGKTILAFRDENEVEEIIKEMGLKKYTPNSITSLDVLKVSFDIFRRQGYGLEDEEGEIGVRCIGAPILDSENGYAIAAISVAAHTSNLKEDMYSEIGQKVRSTADMIANELASNNRTS